MSDIASRTVLSNGLTVITREVHKVPIASFWVWYRVGSRNESAGTTGISHWVEHMMFKGTPSIRKGDIFRLVNAAGGVLNGFTWLDYTAYFETLPSHRIDLAISIESDRMANSLFLPEEVESERTVIISEREGSENSPVFLLGEELSSAAFQAHPYGHSVIGWKSDLQSMTRDDLFEHYRTYYAPNNAIVVAVGDFDTAALMEQIRASFEAIPPGPKLPRVRAGEPPQRGERRVTVRHPAGVPHFEVAYHAPAVSDQDAFPMLLLDAVLSGGKPMGMFGSRGARMGRSSRLYRSLVHGGLASGAGSSVALTTDPYLFGIEATPRPDVGLQELEAAVLREVETLQRHGVGQEEFQRALKQVRAQLVYGSESVTDLGYWLGAMETIDRYETYGEMLERVEKVTPEDVKRVAERYLTDTNRTIGWLIPTEPEGRDGETGRRGDGGNEDAETRGRGDAGTSAPGTQDSAPTRRGARPAAPTDPEPGTQNPEPDPAPSTQHSALSTQRSAPSPQASPPARSRTANPGVSLDIHREQLGNGVVVLVNQDGTIPQVVVRASLLAGSVFDAVEMSGIARFVAPMLIRGTGARSFEELNQETDNLGMALNVEAGRLTAQVGVRCLREDFGRALEIMADVLRNPSFPADEMEKLRGQIVTGLREQETSPRARAERRFLAELYPEGHPYHLWPTGTLDTIGRIGRDDLRAFYRRHYRPDQLTISVVGDLAADQAVDQIQRVLGDWQGEDRPPQLEIPPVDLPAATRRDEVVPGKFQSEFVLGLPALSRGDPDYYALRLGNLVLGELGLSGRLGASIRERQGLAYHVSSDLQASVGPSPWAVRAGVNPANVDRAVEAALQEIERWRTDLVGDEELADGKCYLTGSLPIGLETNDGVARTLLDIEFYGLGLDFLQRYPAIIEGVTPERIRDAVRRWIDPQHLVLVVAGPGRQ